MATEVASQATVVDSSQPAPAPPVVTEKKKRSGHTVASLAKENDGLRADIQALRQQLAEVLGTLGTLTQRLDKHESEHGITTFTYERPTEQLMTQMYEHMEPKCKALYESLTKIQSEKIAASAVEQAKTAVTDHVQRQTQRVDQLAERYATRLEKGNRDAEALMQRTTSCNVRLLDVGSTFRDANKMKLQKSAQQLVNKVTKGITVVDAKFHVCKYMKGGEEKIQSNLVVTCQGPAAASELIEAAKKAQ